MTTATSSLLFVLLPLAARGLSRTGPAALELKWCSGENASS